MRAEIEMEWENQRSASLAPVTGEKGRNFMRKNKSNGYTNAPADVLKEMEASVPVNDFLPSPEKIATLLQKKEMIPVTMKLQKSTVERYKKFARKKGIKYQTFLSTLLDTYAQKL